MGDHSVWTLTLKQPAETLMRAVGKTTITGCSTLSVIGTSLEVMKARNVSPCEIRCPSYYWTIYGHTLYLWHLELRAHRKRIL
jgi:hypothetical protein